MIIIEGALTASFKRRHPYMLKQNKETFYYSAIWVATSSIMPGMWRMQGKPEDWHVQYITDPQSKLIQYEDLIAISKKPNEEQEAIAKLLFRGNNALSV